MEPQQEPQQNISFPWTAVSIGAAFFFCAALLYYLFSIAPVLFPRSTENTPAPVVGSMTLNELLQQQYRGDFEGAAREAENVLSGLTATSSLEAQRTITVLANANIWSGELEKHLEAVNLAKEQLRDQPGSRQNQAFIINRLIGYMTAAMEPEVIEEVFKGEPFALLYNPDDIGESIFKNLAGESLSRYPTFLAYAGVGIWHAEKLFKEYDDIETLSDAERREAVSGVQDALTKMNGIIDEELKANIVYKQTKQAQFDYYQEFLYGALALTDPTYLKKMEESYKRVRTEVAAQKNADGDSVALLDVRLVYADFAYATYLNAIAGRGGAEDVKRSLQEMIELVEASPESHQGGFLAFVRQTMKNGPNGTEGHGRWYSYGRFVQMAAVHPPFKEFLNTHGWNLQ